MATQNSTNSKRYLWVAAAVVGSGLVVVAVLARHKIIDWYRAKGSQPLPLEEIENEDQDVEDKKLQDVLDARKDVKALEGALDQLEPAYRDVLVLKYVEGYEVREIAEKLGVSENVVYVRVHRGRKKLMECLAV